MRNGRAWPPPRELADKLKTSPANSQSLPACVAPRREGQKTYLSESETRWRVYSRPAAHCVLGSPGTGVT